MCKSSVKTNYPKLALIKSFSALLGVVLVWAMSMAPLKAQDTPEPLVVPFTWIPPFMELDSDGERTGFVVDLSELIGAEIGVPIEYLEVENTQEFVAAQVSGQTQFIAGILQLAPLVATNVFSDQVASDELRPAILAEKLAEVKLNGLTGLRIAVVPPAAGHDHVVLEKNTRVEFKTPQAAVMALISHNVDAALLPPPVVYGLAREASIDGRIAFFGEPLQTSSRHVALHSSRAEL